MDFSKLPNLWNPPTQNAPQTNSPQSVQGVPRISSEHAMANNPFMISVNPDNPTFQGHYGVNKPLKKAMFLGYWNDKPLYGGSRLFLLY